MAPEYFWPGVAFLALGSLLHLWAKGCLRQYKALTVCGPYRFVRHPFYLSYLVIDIGLCLMIANLYIAAVYFPIWLAVYYFQIRREELKLLDLYGKKYADYRRRVPALLPCSMPAPCAEGQSFSWSNPNITRRSEIPRLLRLALFPLFFFLAYRFRVVELDFLFAAGQAEMFALSALIAVFFFSKLLNPAIKRHRRMLPAWLESRAPLAAMQIAVLALAVSLGVPQAWGSWQLETGVTLASGAMLAVFVRPLKKVYLPLILTGSAVAVAWQMYWLVPIVSFYYASCAIDDKLFPKQKNKQEPPVITCNG
jgi:protein-S-isoprenylcysteine O-methyltransferase Ste14